MTHPAMSGTARRLLIAALTGTALAASPLATVASAKTVRGAGLVAAGHATSPRICFIDNRFFYNAAEHVLGAINERTCPDGTTKLPVHIYRLVGSNDVLVAGGVGVAGYHCQGTATNTYLDDANDQKLTEPCG